MKQLKSTFTLLSLIFAFFTVGNAFADPYDMTLYDMTPAAIEKRIAPSGDVSVAGAPAPGSTPAVSAVRTAEQIYTKYCAVCHDQGIAGAPAVGNKSAWQERLAQGRDTLIKRSISGFNAMPSRGTCMDCTDDEMAATVDYMLHKAGVK